MIFDKKKLRKISGKKNDFFFQHFSSFFYVSNHFTFWSKFKNSILFSNKNLFLFLKKFSCPKIFSTDFFAPNVLKRGENKKKMGYPKGGGGRVSDCSGFVIGC